MAGFCKHGDEPFGLHIKAGNFLTEQKDSGSMEFVMISVTAHADDTDKGHGSYNNDR